jgi:acetamidase/formamidase
VGLDIPAAPPEAIDGIFPNVRQHVYCAEKIKGRDVFRITDNVYLPARPFMGRMATAPATGVFIGRAPNDPPPANGIQNEGVPGPFGGNMDLKDLTIGSTLYLPVFQSGAQFFVGDSHSAQGDGEVSGTAIEHSLSGVFRFILHKGKTIEWPRAETDTHFILMGIDHDFNRAMRIATLEVVKFLVEEMGFTTPKAFSLASIGVDFKVTEVVDGTQVASGYIPKSLFVDLKRHRDYRKD